MCDVQKNKILKEILKSLDIWFVTLFSQTKKARSQKKKLIKFLHMKSNVMKIEYIENSHDRKMQQLSFE